MEWTEPRDVLVPTKINYKNLYYKPSMGDMDRNKILKACGYTCRTCGRVYKTYLILSYVLKDDIYDMYCGACHLVTHLNIGLPKGIGLYHSEMTQLEIIRGTVDYIIKTQQMPTLQQIDPNVKEACVSLFEYVNLLDHVDGDQFANYKIFFNADFNINFVTNNYGSINQFDDGESCGELQLNVSQLNANDMGVLNKLFKT